MTEQDFRKLVVCTMQWLAENGPRYRYSFDILETGNEGRLFLQKGHTKDAQLWLTVGAAARGDDHLVQHFYHSAASLEEMKQWLTDPSNADGIIESLWKLSDRVDEGFD